MSASGLRSAVVVLAAGTALIHFYLLLGFFDLPFLANGLGYLGLLAAFLFDHPWLNTRRRLLHYVFIGYTIVTIVAWLAVGEKAAAIAYIDKAIEVSLIVCLWLSLRSH